MDIEFHYYINYLIALKAGFNTQQSYKIAYSAQFVDDNTEKIIVLNEKNAPYHSIITQNYSLFTNQEELLKTYLCFHFIPGDINEASNLRKDNATHMLTTTPGSFLARKMLHYACSQKNLYALGIVSHAFADTWAHANFVGIRDDFNKSEKLLCSFVPNIGHADFFDKPDKINLVWEDDRLLNPKVDNRVKFIQAAKTLLLAYHKAFNPNIDIKNNNMTEFEDDILTAVGEPGQYSFSQRLNNYQMLADKYSNKNIPLYDKDVWKSKAYCRSNVGYRWKNTFTSSDWYLFQEAAKKYQKYAWNLIKKRVNFSKKFNSNDIDDTKDPRIYIN